MMNNRTTAVFVATALCITLTACAQTKKSAAAKTKKTKKDATLVQATSQKTLPGRPETPPRTDYRFVLVWNSSDEPTTFFWRGDESWQACNVSKVKNFKPLVVKKNDMSQQENYEKTEVDPAGISANDTLELYPISLGKHPIPEGVDANRKNVIHIKTKSEKWVAVPVDSITRLPTIVMP